MKVKGKFVAAIITVIFCINGNVWAYCGDGSAENPYQITNVDDWAEFATTSADWSNYFILTANIDFAGAELVTVGNATTTFSGQFDGDGHTFSNFKITTPDVRNGTAIFPRSTGTIKDLKVSSATITGSNHEAGGIYSQYNAVIVAELAYGGSITGCTVTSCTVTGYQTAYNRPVYTGMIVGANHGNIQNCTVVGGSAKADLITTGTPISSNCYIGGVVGYQVGGTATGELGYTKDCSSSATVGSLLGTSTGYTLYAVGGVAGCLAESGTDIANYIENCHFTGAIEVVVLEHCDVGGVIGRTIATTNVTNCSSVCDEVTFNGSNGRVGGLIGMIYGYTDDLDSTTMTNCFANCDISVCMGTSGYVGGAIGQATGYSCNASNAIISNCYSMGSVYDAKEGSTTLGFWYGGFAGTLNTATVRNCFCQGDTYAAKTGITNIKGFVGHSINSTYGDSASTCFWDSTTSGVTATDSYDYTEAKTTTELQTLSTFTDAGWDFSDADGDPADWMMLRESEDYPRLIWQPTYPGDIAGLYGVDMVDLMELINNLLEKGCPSGCEQADIDNNGIVDLADLSILAANWLK